MSETPQASDFDATIHFLQQDLASADIALAINYIEQWENQLQGTELFQSLMQLKQAVLDGNLTELETVLRSVGEATIAAANDIRANGAADVAVKVEQIGQRLAEVSHSVK